MTDLRSTIDVEEILTPDKYACLVSDLYTTWKSSRSEKEQEWAELRNYVFATDTTTTTNSQLPWSNKTTRPKLCQIRDNLHANYMAALFPNDNWLKWMPKDLTSASKEKRNMIEGYVAHKLRESKFKATVSRMVYDYIDYGNVFGDVEYVRDVYVAENEAGQKEEVVRYIGPRAYRISPYDIVFDIRAGSFESSAKIIRSLLTYGDIERLVRTDPIWKEVDTTVLDRTRENRKTIGGSKIEDIKKQEGFIADGFSSITSYYTSGLVEVLDFEGDLFNIETGEYLTNTRILVVDRAYVIYNKPIYNWLGRSSKQHAGWRLRPDNLMGMGPLDNIVGMQYRIDHLENLRADVFDEIAYPMYKIKGFVEDFELGPNERIYCGEEGDVEALRPDSTALQADFQIQQLEYAMEEMAGAPKQAMGIRTPGEKTAFEVQTLDNAAGRMFQQKIAYFEENFIEPLVNHFFEEGRRNLEGSEVIPFVNSEYGVTEFLTITKDDLKAKGRLVPMGARHFAAQAQLVQNLTSLANTGIYQDPAVQVHFSGLKMAEVIEEALNLQRYGIVQPNIRITEQADTQKLATAAEDDVTENALTPTEDTPDAVITEQGA